MLNFLISNFVVILLINTIHKLVYHPEQLWVTAHVKMHTMKVRKKDWRGYNNLTYNPNSLGSYRICDKPFLEMHMTTWLLPLTLIFLTLHRRMLGLLLLFHVNSIVYMTSIVYVNSTLTPKNINNGSDTIVKKLMVKQMHK